MSTPGAPFGDDNDDSQQKNQGQSQPDDSEQKSQENPEEQPVPAVNEPELVDDNDDSEEKDQEHSPLDEQSVPVANEAPLIDDNDDSGQESRELADGNDDSDQKSPLIDDNDDSEQESWLDDSDDAEQESRELADDNDDSDQKCQEQPQPEEQLLPVINVAEFPKGDELRQMVQRLERTVKQIRFSVNRVQNLQRCSQRVPTKKLDRAMDDLKKTIFHSISVYTSTPGVKSIPLRIKRNGQDCILKFSRVADRLRVELMRTRSQVEHDEATDERFKKTDALLAKQQQELEKVSADLRELKKKWKEEERKNQEESMKKRRRRR
uniref:Pinin_SDK_memA domain-containing protein n=1 Tax=Steinernema glaseri TaxID=37863 RepID=A0A1I7YSG0_9BILA